MIRSIFRHLVRVMLPAEKYARLIGVKVGKNNYIATKYWSTEPYLITIGNNCQITSGVRFHTHGGVHVLREKYADFDSFGKIQVGDYVYIGSGSQILPGVTIGDGALIAAGSIVTKSVAPHTIVGGNPARILGNTEDFLEKMLPYNTHSKGMNPRNKKKLLLSLDETLFVRK